MNSDGCTFTTKSDSQRRDPLTDLPIPGTSTSTSSTAPAMNSQGASRCQRLHRHLERDGCGDQAHDDEDAVPHEEIPRAVAGVRDASDIAIDAE